MTHDSIGLGEDGPTHQVNCTVVMMAVVRTDSHLQQVAMLATTRAIPNLYVIRPADGNEVGHVYV